LKFLFSHPNDRYHLEEFLLTKGAPMEQRDDLPADSETASSSFQAVQIGTFRHEGDYWTIGYGGVTFRLRHVLGLTHIHRLLQHPGEQFHAVDLLTGAAIAETSRPDSSGPARFANDESVTVASDLGPLPNAQPTQDYRRRIWT
jgi:hypothetical protein